MYTPTFLTHPSQTLSLSLLEPHNRQLQQMIVKRTRAYHRRVILLLIHIRPVAAIGDALVLLVLSNDFRPVQALAVDDKETGVHARDE